MLNIDRFTVRSALKGFRGEPISQGTCHEIRKRMVKELMAVQSQNQMRNFLQKYSDGHIRSGGSRSDLQRLSWEWDFLMIPYREELREDYVNQYRTEFERCLLIEMTDFGRMVRINQGLAPLTMEDSIQFNTYQGYW